MTDGREDNGDDSVRGSLPLLVLTGLLFTGAAVLRWLYPRLGPYSFPLWGLLLTLGFVAAIGSIVSLFFAEEDERRLDAPERTTGPVAADSPSERDGFGRPSPDLAISPPSAPPASVAERADATKPWDEDVLPPAPVRGPRPVLTTLDDPGDIARALEEIAEIQRQLASRPVAAPNANKAPARA
jgi:hypothetical protein